MDPWLTYLVFAIFGASLGALSGTEAYFRDRFTDGYARVEAPRLPLAAFAIGLVTLLGIGLLTRASIDIVAITLPMSLVHIVRHFKPRLASRLPNSRVSSISTIVFASLCWLIYFSQGAPL